MALTEQEQKNLDIVLQHVAAGDMDEAALRNLKKLLRQNDKARKAAAARERMKDILPARLLDIFPIDYDRNDLTEVGQAIKFAHNCQEYIRYTEEYGWLFYERIGDKGGRWQKNALEQVKKLYHSFNDDQVHEALNLLNEAPSSDTQEATQAEELLKFALRMRTAGAVNRVIDQAKPYVLTKAEELDANPYTLNTPSGLYDLRTGKLKASRPSDLCCHMTMVGADEGNQEGEKLWLQFLDDITQGNQALNDYLFQVIGRAAFGRVKAEELVFLYGNGANGKSTFINTVAAVLGDYAITYDGEILMDTNSSRHFDLARLHGARLAVFNEIKENRTFDTATLKRITSTDNIHAEIKYQDPFDFKPSHSAFLHANHLPRVNARDEGTWRRLLVCPFNAHFDNKTRKLDYSEELTNKAGSFILHWIIQGAIHAAQHDYKIEAPACVSDMIRKYRIASDWLLHYLDERCEEGADYSTTGAKLYSAYLSQCAEDGIPQPISQRAFYKELESYGLQSGKSSEGRYFKGLQLKSNSEEEG